MNNTPNKILYVCYQKPAGILPDEATVLSFLSPHDDQILRDTLKQRYLSGREKSERIKAQALDIYIKIVSQIGACANNRNETLRALLKNDDGVSLWWFHRVSFKDSENDPTFNSIIQILTIAEVAAHLKIQSIIAVGAPQEIIGVLKSRFNVAEINTIRTSALKEYIWCFLRRCKFAMTAIAQQRSISSKVNNPPAQSSVFLTGFWDWSVKKDAKSGQLKDEYFRELPKKFKEQGEKLSWLTWCDPKGSQKTLSQLLEAVKEFKEIIIVQKFLTLNEIIASWMNLKPLFIFLGFTRLEQFRNIFKKDTLDFYPAFKTNLTAGFLDYTLPYHEMIAKGFKKVTQFYQPSKVLTFMNFFPLSRAMYAGIKGGSASVKVYDVQHASYNREKTIGVLDAQVEFEGKNDGCPIPQADYMFVMGQLGHELFSKNGFPQDRLFLQGSCRYDKPFNKQLPQRKIRVDSKINILVVTTLRKDYDAEMVEAVYHAFKGFDDVQVYLRVHPFSRNKVKELFKKYEDRVQITNNTSLDEDLDRTDIVIFSYSTVAEEAFVRGIPAWQWLTAGANLSALEGVAFIQRVASIDGLKKMFLDYTKAPQKYIPSDSQRLQVNTRCFYSEGGIPSDNIVNMVLSDSAKMHIQ